MFCLLLIDMSIVNVVYLQIPAFVRLFVLNLYQNSFLFCHSNQNGSHSNRIVNQNGYSLSYTSTKMVSCLTTPKWCPYNQYQNGALATKKVSNPLHTKMVSMYS
jgi:hypothetical protein